jgi:hypothetical protein
MKKTAALSALLMILSGALARAEDATPAATQKYTQAELDASPYLKSVVTREGPWPTPRSNWPRGASV